MRIASLLVMAALALAGTVSPARAGAVPAAVRAYMAGYSASRLERAHAMIPAWARRYSKNCNACHWPAVPRLNAYGMKFKWAGYRPPDELGEQVTVQKVENYLAVRGRMRYQYNQTQDQSPSNSQFSFEDYTIFAGGPFGKNYGAFFELERSPEELELVANVASAWGKENSFGGFRIGQFHWLQREGLAGFDRPIGINTASPLGGKITGSIPFSFNNDQVGAEGYYVKGNNRASVEILNGVNRAGIGDEGDTDRKKDFAFIDQYLIDDAGSGITAMGYYGSLVNLDSLSPGLTSHFWRLGLTANKILDERFEVVGMVLYGKDFDLPASAPDNKGVGYWFQGGYMFPNTSVTVFGRFEYVDPNTDIPTDSTVSKANRRYVLGGVVPIGLPEYLRFALEGTLDTPTAAGALKKYGVTAQLMLNF